MLRLIVQNGIYMTYLGLDKVKRVSNKQATSMELEELMIF